MSLNFIMIIKETEECSSNMEKFSINNKHLSDNIFFESIVQKSAFTTKHNIEDFYTFGGLPKDYMKQVIKDIRKAQKVVYKECAFYICRGINNCVAYIFYDGSVYSFDEYYQDCPIFASLLK